MDTKKLRQKILDLAIRGKLVPQDPNDEPASVLLERIRAEKERLIKEGKIKRSKKAATDEEFEAPFEIPESWAWTDVESFTYDLQYGTSEKSSAQGEVPVLRMGNITRVGTVDFTDLVYSSNKADISKYALLKDDLLFNRTNSSEWVGKTAIYKSDSPAIYAGYLIRVRCILVCPDFINVVLNSSYHRDWCNQVKTDAVNQSNINAQKLSSHLVPIPPYKEQLRIANEVQRWFVLLDELESNEGDLLKAIDQAKSKILDLAIHGKLVPQDPNDEPAIDLLKRINPKFEPCEVSNDVVQSGWCVAKLEDLVELLDNKRVPVKSDERQQRIKNKEIVYPYYGATGLVGYIDDYLIDGHYILLGEDGAPFEDKFANVAYEVKGKIWVNNHAHILSPKISFEYLLLSLNAVDYTLYAKGTTRLKLTQKDMLNIPILVPPINEQQRIVSKIEELFTVLDSIKASLA